ncbi:response regulator [Vibrio penaeicida]|uniref:HD domain-containing phosphohydrolase n=1 Tax=Vibrio penaeicida TaxID=104609 RepID=UPI0027376E13|nr:HD domain-containing phosphohydrolase [Vibrio penaeicida]MDP2573752.1 response regulator [Vibrio penaeicida]
MDDLNALNTISKPKLVLLDDEADILKALTRVLRRDFEIHPFTEPSEALSYLEAQEVAIIVSDMKMPDMDGATFFGYAKDIQPEAVRILLTGYSDVEDTVRAINDGGVSTYLSKPWDNDNLRFTLQQSLEFFRVKEEKNRLRKELESKNDQLAQVNVALEEKVALRTEALRESNVKLKNTLKSRSGLFRDVLSLITGLISFRTGCNAQDIERVAYQSKQVAILYGLDEAYVKQTYMCGIMHKLGIIGTDQDVHLGQNYQQSHIAPSSNPDLGAELISQLPRFQSIASLVRHQDENFDGTGYPGHIKGKDIPIASRILRVVKDYDYMVAGENNKIHKSPFAAQNYLQSNSGTIYDKEVVKTFVQVLQERPQDGVHEIEYCVGVNELNVGDVLKRDVMLSNGSAMLTSGSEINEAMLRRLIDYERHNNTTLAYFI